MMHSATHTLYLMQQTTVISTPGTATTRADAAQGANAPEAPVVYGPIPRGGGRVIVQKDGDRTIITTTSVPPQMMVLARRAQETAFGLIGLLGLIIILGPFARMWARRLERRHEMNTLDSADMNAQRLQQQLVQLQQSVDAMSVEVERISESQRYQSRLLHEKQGV